MINYYTPNALIAMRAKIVRQHDKKNLLKALSENELKRLLNRIKSIPEEELELEAQLLTEAEKAALASYFPGNQYHYELHKVAVILSYTMKDSLYAILLSGWQNFPRNRELMSLLSRHIECLPTADPGMNREFFTSNNIKSWLDNVANPAVMYRLILRSVLNLTRFSTEQFNSRYMKAGLRIPSDLYYNVLFSYMGICSFEELKIVGDKKLAGAMDLAGAVNMTEGIMLNLLTKGKGRTRELYSFKTCYRKIYSIYGVPERTKFPENREDAYIAYNQWYNYKILYESFNHDADPRRLNFWFSYVDSCKVSKIAAKEFVILEFDQYCVVESEVMGFLYFYNKAYYREFVLRELRRGTKQESKSWMKNESEYVYKKAHMGYWESDVSNRMRRLRMV